MFLAQNPSADAPPKLRNAMEQVAGQAEKLSKSKTKDDAPPPPPFRKRVTQSVSAFADWDPKQYRGDGAASRDQRAKERSIRVFGINELGMEEYQKLLKEIDQMTGKVDMGQLVNKRVQELKERLQQEAKDKEEAEQREMEAEKRPTTRSTATTSATKVTEDETRPTKAGKKPVEKGKEAEPVVRPTKAGKKPRTAMTTTTTTTKPTSETETPRPTKGGKKPTKPVKSTPKDLSEEPARAKIDEEDESRDSKKKPKPKTGGKKPEVHFEEEDKEDQLDDLVLLEREVEPLDDEDDDNDETYKPPVDNEDDDDFEIPKLRSRKMQVTRKGRRQLKREHKKAVKDFEATGKTTRDVEIPDDYVFDLFREIVGPNFPTLATEEFDRFPQDKSVNPVEAAGFRITMKELAARLKEAVKKGKRIEESYRDMIEQTIKISRAMEYPGANKVEVDDIIPSIPDRKCNAWREHLRGRTNMDMTDFAADDEDEDEADNDLVIQGPALSEDQVTEAARLLKSLEPMMRNDACKLLADLYENQARAHEHAAASCRILKQLHRTLPFDVFLRIADGAVRPLVLMQIPQTEAVVTKLKEAAEASRKKTTGMTLVTEVMEKRNLPQLHRDWTMSDVDKPKKMVACIIFKFVRDAMFPTDPTPTHMVVKEFGVKQTTIHRHMYGKRYPGGGQVLDQMKDRDAKLMVDLGRRVEESTSGATKAKKPRTETIQEDTSTSKSTKKGKGGGKTSSRKRTAEEIRDESTAEEQKRKRQEKAVEREEEEDPDMPTKAEIAASKPGKKSIIIH